MKTGDFLIRKPDSGRICVVQVASIGTLYSGGPESVRLKYKNGEHGNFKNGEHGNFNRDFVMRYYREMTKEELLIYKLAGEDAFNGV